MHNTALVVYILGLATEQTVLLASTAYIIHSLLAHVLSLMYQQVSGSNQLLARISAHVYHFYFGLSLCAACHELHN